MLLICLFLFLFKEFIIDECIEIINVQNFFNLYQCINDYFYQQDGIQIVVLAFLQMSHSDDNIIFIFNKNIL